MRATVQGANAGDTTTSIEPLIEAAEQVERIALNGEIKEMVAGKRYQSNQVMVDSRSSPRAQFISEPDR